MVVQDDPALLKTRTAAERTLRSSRDPEERARAFLVLGTVYEREFDWERAVECYTSALAGHPRDPAVRYFGHNNLGYSLILLERPEDAEPHCLAAIAIEPRRHNAHKNLGLVRQAQARWLEAAFCFLQADRLCPADQRARHLLDVLLSGHPDLSRSERLSTALLELDSSHLQPFSPSRGH